MARPGGVLLSALCGLSISMGSALADPLDQNEATAILKRIADAARQLSFKGIYVHQQGEQSQASQIHHLADNANEFEKLESLDGPRREAVRINDEVRYYYPGAKLVRIEKRQRRAFPAVVMPEEVTSIVKQYRIRKGGAERIAGYDSVALELEPRDGMRYGHKFWTETNTGLLLKARMIDEHQNMLEQVSFIKLEIGPVDRSAVKPSFKTTSGWREDRLAPPAGTAPIAGWIVGLIPEGFRKILETQSLRTKQGTTVTATHMIFSDGLASVSIFIEPLGDRELKDHLSRQGAYNVYRRAIDNQVVTVLGEAPAVAVQQIGDSVTPPAK